MFQRYFVVFQEATSLTPDELILLREEEILPEDEIYEIDLEVAEEYSLYLVTVHQEEITVTFLNDYSTFEQAYEAYLSQDSCDLGLGVHAMAIAQKDSTDLYPIYPSAHTRLYGFGLNAYSRIGMHPNFDSSAEYSPSNPVLMEDISAGKQFSLISV